MNFKKDSDFLKKMIMRAKKLSKSEKKVDGQAEFLKRARLVADDVIYFNELCKAALSTGFYIKYYNELNTSSKEFRTFSDFLHPILDRRARINPTISFSGIEKFEENIKRKYENLPINNEDPKQINSEEVKVRNYKNLYKGSTDKFSIVPTKDNGDEQTEAIAYHGSLISTLVFICTTVQSSSYVSTTNEFLLNYLSNHKDEEPDFIIPSSDLNNVFVFYNSTISEEDESYKKLHRTEAEKFEFKMRLNRHIAKDDDPTKIIAILLNILDRYIRRLTIALDYLENNLAEFLTKEQKE